MQQPNPTIVFPAPGRVTVEHQPVPQPQADEVQIRTHCSLISVGTELSVLGGDSPTGQVWREMQEYPFQPGYCNVGTVLAAGDDVDSNWIGRRVVSWGCHAAFVTVDLDHCWPVPDECSEEEAAFLVLFHVAANGLRRSGLVLGESAVVYGLGIIGQLTARLCQAAGARPVFGVDVSPERVAYLPEHNGVRRVIAAGSNVADVVAAETRGRMADVVFEVTANADLFPSEVAILRNEGRFVIISSPRTATLFDFHDLCNRPSITIIGAHNWSHPPRETVQTPWTMARHAELFFDLIASRDLDVKTLISHRIAIDETPQFYEQLVQDRSQVMGALVQYPDC